jgi:hypothetical protein
MSAKSSQVSPGNAAERLKMKRAMPTFSLSEPLPPEGGQAVAVTAAVAIKPAPKVAAKRSYRICTYLTEEAGVRLQRLVTHMKATKGRRHGAPEVIERALIALERELGQ